jgi:hypothetical protein
MRQNSTEEQLTSTQLLGLTESLAQITDPDELNKFVQKYSINFKWLKSDFTANKWTVIADSDVNSQLDDITLNFELSLGQHGNMRDARFKHTLHTLKVLVILTRINVEPTITTRKSGGQQQSLIYKVRQIFQALLDMGVTKLEYASAWHCEELLDKIVTGTLQENLEEKFTTYVDDCINDNTMPHTYYNSGKKLLSVKALANMFGENQQLLSTNQTIVYQLDRLRCYFNLDLKGRKNIKTEAPESVKLSASGLSNYASTLSDLHAIFISCPTLDGFIHDPLDEHTIHSFSNAFGSSSSRTRTLPVTVVFKLVSEASETLFKYSEFAVKVQDVLVKMHNISHEELGITKKNCCKEHYSRERSKVIKKAVAKLADEDGVKEFIDNSTFELSDLKNLVKSVVAASIIIMLAFTARRDTEIKRLKLDCLEECANENLLSFGETKNPDYLISVYVAKTEKKYDTFPTNNLLIKAVESMKAIAELSQPHTGKTLLLQWFQMDSGRHGAIKNYAALITFFAEKKGLTKDLSGQETKYACHQFRRFFAILFYWRYGEKDIYALSSYLGHFSIEMTKLYIQELTGDGLFNEEERKWLAKTIGNAWYKGQKLGGDVGKGINDKGKKLIASFKSRLKLIKPSRLETYLENKQRERLVQQKLEGLVMEAATEEVDQLALKVRFTSYGIICFGQSEGLRNKVRCVPASERTIHSMPQPQNASFDMCSGCAAGGCVPESKHLVEGKLNNAITIAAQENGGILAVRAKNEVEICKKYLKEMA